jgi:hypothetical protein
MDLAFGGGELLCGPHQKVNALERGWASALLALRASNRILICIVSYGEHLAKVRPLSTREAGAGGARPGVSMMTD